MNRKILHLALLVCLVAPAAVFAQNSVQVLGFIQTAPDGGVVGDWLIGGQLITITETTEIDGETDDLQAGACVAVDGGLNIMGALVAEQISIQDPQDCGGVGQNPGAEDVSFTAEVASAPSGGLTGSWTIGSFTVTTDSFTSFDGAEAGFASGACVEVDGVLLANGTVRASEMEVEDEDACGPTGGQAREAELRGIAESIPAGQTFGLWNVRGLNVNVTAATELNTDAGEVMAGACVKVEGSIDEGGALEAREVTILAEDRCVEPNESSFEFAGTLDAVPDGAGAGTWTVMGIDVTVNNMTQLALELGPAQPGVCVKVAGTAEMGMITARQIRVLGLNCGGPSEGPQMISFQGQVQGVPPAGNTGQWRVSGRTVLVIGTTNVNLDGQDPSTSLCVEVEGEMIPAGFIQATSITALSEGCTAVPGPPALTEITGTVNTLPDGNVGDWDIGGTQVTVSEGTELNTDAGEFMAGACVRIEGRYLPDGGLMARQVSTLDAASCAENNQVEFTGLITGRPADSQLGDWTISEQQVTVAEETEFDTTDGPLRLGSCVEVAGTSQEDGSLLATSLDVESASGACVQAVVSGGSFELGAVSPGDILTIFGLGFGPGGGRGLEVVDGFVTNSLGGVQVFFDGEPATILFASGNQINVVAPYSLAGKSSTTMQVVYSGIFTKTRELNVAPASPAILTLEQVGAGQAAALNWEADTQMYTVNGPDNPAEPGQIVLLYAVGAGQTVPEGEDGAVIGAGNLPQPVLPVSVTVGGMDAEILYAGGAPELVSGVLQVNIRVPENLTATGDVDVTLNVGQFSSASAVTIYIQQ